MSTEIRVTSSTGGQKGVKGERHDLIPLGFLRELALVYGYGAEKYDDNNWRKGYEFSLSYGALMRHVAEFMNGNDYDAESGLHHLAHAAFHLAALYVWTTEDYSAEFDDRQVDAFFSEAFKRPRFRRDA